MVERSLDLHRDAAIQGVDGFEAVRLWHRYRHGDRAALRKLILYNLTDVANLVELVETAVKLKSHRMAFPGNAAPFPPCGMPKPDSENLAEWIEKFLRSVNVWDLSKIIFAAEFVPFLGRKTIARLTFRSPAQAKRGLPHFTGKSYRIGGGNADTM